MFKDTHLFQTTANFFVKYGKYTSYIPGTKAYRDFWKEEKKRCKEGYEVGGVRITGYHYNYLNFSPILKTQIIKESDSEFGQNQAERVLGFPQFWDGDYDFFHYIEQSEIGGQHSMLGGSRGRGKSLKAASMCVRNYFHYKKSKSYCFASKEEYLLKDGIISKAWELMDFIDNFTPWAKRRHEENSSMHRKASTKIKNEFGIETIDPRSYMSEIIGVTTGDNINKLRGKRGKLIILEEGGSYPNLNKGFNILRPSMEDGKNTFGLILVIGTGGEEGSNFEGFEELFINPKAYNIKPVKNIWDEGLEDTDCAFFFPADKNYSGCMDGEGNSDREKARRIIEADRKLVAAGNDPHALTRRKAELPLCPREMMMRIYGTQFPVDMLRQQESEITTKPHLYRDADFIGKLELDSELGTYKWKTDLTLTPIYERNLKDNKNLPGAIVIYSHPATTHKGVPYPNRYYIGVDSYDQDESTTTSLGSCFVGDLWTKKIVAEYTGRPPFATDFYETVRRLAIYYNAKCNIEYSNIGIFRYFDSRNSMYLMMDEPKIVSETKDDISIHNYNGTRRVGTRPTKFINKYHRMLTSQWLRSSTNNPDKPEELHVHTFRCLPAIKEMIVWNIDGNFDRVSALGMLMLAFEDKENYDTTEYRKDYKDLAQDDYFKRNYKY